MNALRRPRRTVQFSSEENSSKANARLGLIYPKIVGSSKFLTRIYFEVNPISSIRTIRQWRFRKIKRNNIEKEFLRSRCHTQIRRSDRKRKINAVTRSCTSAVQPFFHFFPPQNFNFLFLETTDIRLIICGCSSRSMRTLKLFYLNSIIISKSFVYEEKKMIDQFPSIFILPIERVKRVLHGRKLVEPWKIEVTGNGKRYC